MRSDETTPTTWDIAAKNIADPIRLTNVRVDGVAAASAEEGAQAKLWIVRSFIVLPMDLQDSLGGTQDGIPT